MRIGLIAVDSHNFPNVPLMKLSAYHKAKGDHVEWCNPVESLEKPYDIVYQSKIFTGTPDFNTSVRCDQLIKGGTGYDLINKLPEEVEHTYPDYSLYGDQYPEAYGRRTKGCPRGCEFCIVCEKEGRVSQEVAELGEFYKDQSEIKLIDPNLLACKSRIKILDELIKCGASIDFTQGLDIRFTDDEVTDRLKRIKIKMVHFAWDGERDSELIQRNLDGFKKATEIDHRKLAVYVLTNFNTDTDFDLYRVYRLKELGYDPFVMIYDKEKFVTDKNRLRSMNYLLKHFTIEQILHFIKCWKLQRQVNNKIIFHSGTVETETSMRKMIGA